MHVYEFGSGELDSFLPHMIPESVVPAGFVFSGQAVWKTPFGELSMYYSERWNSPEYSNCDDLAFIYHAMLCYPTYNDFVLVFFRSPLELLDFTAKYPVLFKEIILTTPSGNEARPDPDSSASPDPHAPPASYTASSGSELLGVPVETSTVKAAESSPKSRSGSGSRPRKVTQPQ